MSLQEYPEKIIPDIIFWNFRPSGFKSMERMIFLNNLRQGVNYSFETFREVHTSTLEGIECENRDKSLRIALFGKFGLSV